MKVQYDGMHPVGVNQLMRVGGFSDGHVVFQPLKMALYGLATYGALSMFAGTKGFAQIGGFLGATMAFLTDNIGGTGIVPGM